MDLFDGVSRLLLKTNCQPFEDATGLPRGPSRLLLQWNGRLLEDATGLPRGASRLLLFKNSTLVLENFTKHKAIEDRWFSYRETPRDKPVASSNPQPLFVAAIVKLHGTSPWHLNNFSHRLYLKLVLICFLLTIALFVTPVQGQRRTTPKRQIESEPQVSFDTLLSADSYKIYGEARGVGQLIRSEGARDLLDPVMKLAAPPREFRSLVKWLNARADLLMTSRLLFAAWPSRPNLPQILVAIEFPSVEEAEKFAPQLKEFLPKLLPTPAPERSTRASQARQEEPKQNEKAVAPPYVLKQVGSLVFITDEAFALKDLKTKGGRLLAEDQNFRIAQDRFNSESLFLYIDSGAIEKEQNEQRRRAEEEYKRIEAENAKQVQSQVTNNSAVTEPTEPAAAVPEMSPNPDASSGSPQPSEEASAEARLAQPNPMDFAFAYLSSAFFGGRPRWPEGIGAALSFEGDSYVVRVLLVNPASEKASPVPFLPQLAPGPGIIPESPSVLPADAELFVTASLDFQQVYEGMMAAAKAQFEAMQKYSLQSVKVTEPVSPFEAYEKKLGIKIKEDLLPLLGNEIAFTIPMKVLDVGPSTPKPAPSPATGPDAKKQAETEPPSLIFAISIKDREAVKALIPRILDSMGLKGAGILATTEKRDDAELVSYANVVSYAFIGNFLVGSPDPKAVRHVVDSYLNHETLSSSTHFRNYTRWQPRQVMGQVYVSPALMESYSSFARDATAQISEQLRDLLMLLSPVPQPVTYAISDEGPGTLHEVHIPKNLVLLMAAGLSGESGELPLVKNEATARSTMRFIASAEATYQATEGAGRYGTPEELIKAGLISKDLLQNSDYRIELVVSGARFEISAVPMEYGVTGKLSFFLDESSVMRAGDHGGGSATVADKPSP